MIDRVSHWDKVYDTRADDDVTWFEAKPELSLALITGHSTAADPVVDVGAGASRLVDHLLDLGYADITVLDLSQSALKVGQARLGDRAAGVSWQVADITNWAPARTYGLWHDRAVFHFLTDPADREAYVRTLATALRPGGHAVIATFAEDGPEKCSGLPVMRYSPDQLADELDRHAPGAFIPVHGERHMHVSPGGMRQSFQASVFRRAE